MSQSQENGEAAPPPKGGDSGGQAARRPPAKRMRSYGPEQLRHSPKEYFDELRETDVDDDTIALLQNLFSRDLILGNLTDADVHEYRWLARNIVDMVVAEHPDTRSTFTGERRKMLSGDYSNGLSPLNGMEKQWIEMAVFNFAARVSRSKDGFQQKQNSKIHKVSEVRENEHETGGLGSLIPGR